MLIQENLHLTYCTNIHPGESWPEVWANLKQYLPPLKEKLSPQQAMGIGLRLSDQASRQLLLPGHLNAFKDWLVAQNLYVFTLNGFPFGGFHRQRVKDEVHQPDWTTKLRLDYTLRLFSILKELLPEGIDGGISTSPLSYKHWWQSTDSEENMKLIATQHLLEVVLELIQIKTQSGKILHLDIEPEPDGVLENAQEVLDYFSQYLLPMGKKVLFEKLGLSAEKAQNAILEHIQICYDICHFAIEYEEHAQALAKFKQAGIKIGKFQISSALKADLRTIHKELIFNDLEKFNESTYLHQVIALDAKNQKKQFDDLPSALAEKNTQDWQEWRVHFHVPLFVENFQQLSSTQKDVKEVLAILSNQHYSNHLEVETYTWEVLPADLQVDMLTSIARELAWVKARLNEKPLN
jgi:hypothetical protein